MIELIQYPLTYYCRESGKAFRARIAGDHIELTDGNEKIKLSVYHTRKLYRACKGNKSAKNKPRYQRPKLSRRDGYEQYLNEGFKKLVS